MADDVNKNAPTPNDLRAMAQTWSLAGDEMLLKVLQATHKSIMEKAESATSKMAEMNSNLESVAIKYELVNNNFMSLGNTQFIENRVQEDCTDIEAAPETDQDCQASAGATEADVLSGVKDAIATMDAYFDRLEIMADSGSEDDDSEGALSEVVVLKNRYDARPLPHIIGTKKWTEKEHAGVLSTGDSESEDDEIPVKQEQYTGNIGKEAFEKPPKASRESLSDVSEPPDRFGTSKIHQAEAARHEPKPLPPKLAHLPKPALYSNEPPPISRYIEPDDDYGGALSDSSDTSDSPVRHVKDRGDAVKVLPKIPSKLSGDTSSEDEHLFNPLKSNRTGKVHETSQTKVAAQPKNPSKLDGDALSDDGDLFVSKIRETALPHHRHIGAKRIDDDDQRIVKDGKSGSEKEVKKPTGATSVFGSRQGNESIAAAILKNRRKLSTDESNESDSYAERDKVLVRTEAATNKKAVFNESRVANNALLDSECVVKNESNDLRNKVEIPDADKIKTVQKEVTKTKNAILDDLFADLDDDDLFSSIVKTKHSKELPKTTVPNSLFDEDDLLFTKPAKNNDNIPYKNIVKPNLNATVTKSNTDNLFSDTSDSEDLFAVEKNIDRANKTRPKEIFDENRANTQTVSTLFDSSFNDDIVFSKPSNEPTKPNNGSQIKTDTSAKHKTANQFKESSSSKIIVDENLPKSKADSTPLGSKSEHSALLFTKPIESKKTDNIIEDPDPKCVDQTNVSDTALFGKKSNEQKVKVDGNRPKTKPVSTLFGSSSDDDDLFESVVKNRNKKTTFNSLDNNLKTDTVNVTSSTDKLDNAVQNKTVNEYSKNKGNENRDINSINRNNEPKHKDGETQINIEAKVSSANKIVTLFDEENIQQKELAESVRKESNNNTESKQMTDNQFDDNSTQTSNMTEKHAERIRDNAVKGTTDISEEFSVTTVNENLYDGDITRSSDKPYNHAEVKSRTTIIEKSMTDNLFDGDISQTNVTNNTNDKDMGDISVNNATGISQVESRTTIIEKSMSDSLFDDDITQGCVTTNENERNISDIAVNRVTDVSEVKSATKVSAKEISDKLFDDDITQASVSTSMKDEDISDIAVENATNVSEVKISTKVTDKQIFDNLFDDDITQKSDKIYDNNEEKHDFDVKKQKITYAFDEMPPTSSVTAIPSDDESFYADNADEVEVDFHHPLPITDDYYRPRKIEADIIGKNIAPAKEATVKPLKTVGKLKQLDLKINVNTLLPGAVPKTVKNIHKIIESDKTTESSNRDEFDSNKNNINDSKVEVDNRSGLEFDTELLKNDFSKEKARITVKRRPSTRKGRREALRKSAIINDTNVINDEVDKSDNDIPKIETLGSLYADKPVIVKETDVSKPSKSLFDDNSSDEDLFKPKSKTLTDKLNANVHRDKTQTLKFDEMGDGDLFGPTTLRETKIVNEHSKGRKSLFDDSDSDVDLFKPTAKNVQKNSRSDSKGTNQNKVRRPADEIQPVPSSAEVVTQDPLSFFDDEQMF